MYCRITTARARLGCRKASSEVTSPGERALQWYMDVEERCTSESGAAGGEVDMAARLCCLIGIDRDVMHRCCSRDSKGYIRSLPRDDMTIDKPVHRSILLILYYSPVEAQPQAGLR